MTVKDLRKATAAHIDIVVIYDVSKSEIVLDIEDSVLIDAFGAFLIDTVSIRDDATIAATLKMQPIKE